MERYLFLCGKGDATASIPKGSSNDEALSFKVNKAAESGFTLVSAGPLADRWANSMYAVMVRIEDDG